MMLATLATCLWAGVAGAAAQRLPPRPTPEDLKPPAAPQMAATAPEVRAEPQPLRPDPLIAGHDLEVGTFYFHHEDYVGALARFEDAIFNDPESAEAYCRAGDAESKLKHRLPARDDWQRCQKLAESGKWARHAREMLGKHPPS